MPLFAKKKCTPRVAPASLSTALAIMFHRKKADPKGMMSIHMPNLSNGYIHVVFWGKRHQQREESSLLSDGASNSPLFLSSPPARRASRPNVCRLLGWVDSAAQVMLWFVGQREIVVVTSPNNSREPLFVHRRNDFSFAAPVD